MAGTKVIAWDEKKRCAAWKDIKDIAAGDWVWSRADDDSGREGWRQVEEKFVRFGRVLWLTLSGQRLGTTAEHPFWRENHGWTEAGELKIGDRIRTLDGRSAVVEKAEVGDAETVYNFRVADHHTYFVGGPEWGFSVWVHNACTIKEFEQAVGAGKLKLGEARYATGLLNKGKYAEFNAYLSKKGINAGDLDVLALRMKHGDPSVTPASFIPGGSLTTHEGVPSVFGHPAHTIGRHVGQTVPQLQARGIRRASTFDTLPDAEAHIGMAIHNERSAIKAFDAQPLSTNPANNRLVLDVPLGRQTGTIVERGVGVYRGQGVKLIVDKVPNPSGGNWTVITSYPIP